MLDTRELQLQGDAVVMHVTLSFSNTRQDGMLLQACFQQMPGMHFNHSTTSSFIPLRIPLRLIFFSGIEFTIFSNELLETYSVSYLRIEVVS
jgi:hypothetical protein